MKDYVPWVVLALALLAVGIIWYMPGEGTGKLQAAVGYGLLLLLFFFGAVVLIYMVTGKIDISKLLEEKGSGGASMSRFQLLIFTFVIAMSFFLIVTKSGKLPDVPTDVLTLLGISASTYAVSKGIQAGSNDSGDKDAKGPGK
jgi:hypothetical protein